MDIAKLIETEKKLSEYKGEDEVLSSWELRDLLKEQNKDKKEVILFSGIPSLDSLIQGFQGGELNVFSGLTANGKTLLAQTLTKNFDEHGEKSLWFTYEVRPSQFFYQFDSLPLFYLPKVLKDNNLNWLYYRVWEAKIKYGIKAVFIDHLHFLVDMKRHNISLEIGAVMRSLKKIALHFNLVFFLIAHTQKIRLETEPDNNDLRDSSFVAQEADNVFFVWRVPDKENQPKNQSVLKISKNRRYGIMNKKIKLIKVGKYLQELTEELKNGL